MPVVTIERVVLPLGDYDAGFGFFGFRLDFSQVLSMEQWHILAGNGELLTKAHSYDEALQWVRENGYAINREDYI